MASINLEITDKVTGKGVVVCMSFREAQRLYMTLNEVFGDVQFGAKAGQLLTVPSIDIKLDLLNNRKDR